MPPSAGDRNHGQTDADGARPRCCRSDRAPRLLLVEDDRALGAAAGRGARRATTRSTTRPDGQAGLHLALTREYDVMVVDRGLPAIDGIDLIGRLRAPGHQPPRS